VKETKKAEVKKIKEINISKKAYIIMVNDEKKVFG
jgi:hypothetical protein